MQESFAYAGNILRVNLSTGQISLLPTSEYAERFVGGRGVAAKLYWDLVKPETRPLSPENCLIFATGPLGGFAGFSSTRCQVVFKSPASIPESYNYANLGGHWPAQLKFAGYDALLIEGVSDKPVYLEIKDDRVEIRDAAHLWGRPGVEVREAIKSELGRDFRVLAIGPAGENLATMANLLADGDASGSSGGGAVMGSKKLKAIAVRGTGKLRVAQPEKVREQVRRLRDLTRRSPFQHEDMDSEGPRYKRDACFGCIGNCYSRFIYTAQDGTRGKYMCQSGRFYQTRAARYYGEVNEVPKLATRLCDTMGLDSWAIETMIMWLSRCIQAGVLTDDNTGLPMSKLGSLEFIEALLKGIAYRQGFGDVLAHGTSRAAAIIGGKAPALITDFMYSRSDQFTAYGPRMFITTGIFLAMEPRHPIQQLHEV
ncbi:MAG: aldehyde ferredoxin oxidoreductase N-terminal domain-containing protein, partial [Dehalococcoidia bacterium]|nr:aldehyde ferredoxin oxidoreductase N-terminal domain-containing protein [Dehalococcoidia bacterium]